MKYLIVAAAASAITVFALQNNAPTSVQFFLWSVETSLAGVILASVAAGIVLVGVPLWIDRWRLRARGRTLEARAAAAETQLAQRDAASGERRELG